jgi:hypothetical protein
LKLYDVSEVCTASIIRAMMEVVCTSETSYNFNLTTRCYIPETSKLKVEERPWIVAKLQRRRET